MTKRYKLVIPEMVQRKDCDIVMALNEKGLYSLQDCNDFIVEEIISGTTLAGWNWFFKDIPDSWLEPIEDGPVSAEELLKMFKAKYDDSIADARATPYTASELLELAKSAEKNERKRTQPVIDAIKDADLLLGSIDPEKLRDKSWKAFRLIHLALEQLEQLEEQ